MLVVAFDQHREPFGQVIAYTALPVCSMAVVKHTREVVEIEGGEVGVYELPAGITYADFYPHHFGYRVLSAAGLRTSHPCDLWRALASSGMSPVRLWAAVKMVEYTGQSNFWTSLRDQITNWASTPPEQRLFRIPLSKRQWETALDDPNHLSKGKQLSDDLSAGRDLKSLQDALLGPLGDALVGAAEPAEERVLDRP
jgi:hypothetical protein